MPGTFTGPWGNTTGSGSFVTCSLTGSVTSNDLLLVLVCWEPLALTETFAGSLGTNYRNTRAEVVRADGSDWQTEEGDGTRHGGAQIGFWEIGQMPSSYAAYKRGYHAGTPGLPGTPCFPAYDASPTAHGFAGIFAAFWRPDTYNQIGAKFESNLGGTVGAYSVPWCLVKTWKISGWGGEPDFPTGTTGTGAVEPANLYGAGFDSYGYAVGQGEPYDDYRVFPPIEDGLTSDGGDTINEGDRSLAPHQMQLAMAARWGQGSGTFTWNNWPGGTLIDTIDRAQTHADAHLELYYRLLPAGETGTAPISGHGTFGAQTNTQDTDSTHYRHAPTGTGAMLRAASIRAVGVATAGGIWMPQFYRRR